MADMPMSDVAMPDASMSDTPPDSPQSRVRAAATTSHIIDRPPKRHRVHSALRLHTLPLVALKCIISQMYPVPPSRRPAPLPVSFLRPLVHLRLVHPVLRDAFDEHVLSLDLDTADPRSLPSLLTGAMPHFVNLAHLQVSQQCLTEHLLSDWTVYFERAPADLRRLTFIMPSPNGNSQLPELFAAAGRGSVEHISTTSRPILDAFAQLPNNVRTLDLLMHDIDENLLRNFPSITSINLLYRQRLSGSRAKSLVAVLQSLAPTLHTVRLRCNHLTSEDFSFFPRVPQLRKLALFDSVIGDPERGMQFLASCEHLEVLYLEWTRGLSGEDVGLLAERMRGRLRELRIWHCDDVTDVGLDAVAKFCPNVDVDLKFSGQQFSNRALAALGDRVAWRAVTIGV